MEEKQYVLHLTNKEAMMLKAIVDGDMNEDFTKDARKHFFMKFNLFRTDLGFRKEDEQG